MDQVKKRIDSMKDDLIGSIREIVAIKSVEGSPEPGAPFGPGPKAAMDYFAAKAKELGFRTGTYKDMVAWAELGDPKSPMVMVLGHVDVVPEGDGWDCDPYKGMIKDGFVYGRGVMDDKGPIVSALYSLKALEECSFAMSKRVRILVGTNEESGCKAVAQYVKDGQELPVAGFTPDADYPLINGEKGLMIARLSAPFRAQGPVKVLSLNGGLAANSVPDYAEAHIQVEKGLEERVRYTASNFRLPQGSSLELKDLGDGKFTMALKGVPSHGSLPELGVNAVMWLVKVLRTLGVSGEQGKTLESLDRYIGTESYGESLGVCLYDDISRYTSVCLGTMKTEGEKLLFSLNPRFPVTFKIDEISKTIGKTFAEAGWTVISMETDDPLYLPEDSDLVSKLMGVYRKETGRDDKPMAIGGGTYAKSMPNMVAFGPTMPGEESLIHKANERWAVENIIASAKIMAEAIAVLAK